MTTECAEAGLVETPERRISEIEIPNSKIENPTAEGGGVSRFG